MAGCCTDSFSRFLLECGTLFNGRKKCTWGAGMNFPKEKDFSERLKFMGSSFFLKEAVISDGFLTRWVKKGSFIIVIMIRQIQFSQALH